jgi:primary-amine oxidase
MLRRELTYLLVAFMLFGGRTAAGASVTHPMDPLEDAEIIRAAKILLNAGVASPEAIFQSIDLKEPPKDDVLAFQPGDSIPRSATVFFRQNKRSFRTIVNLNDETFTPPMEIPSSDGQLGLTIRELVDFSFVLRNQDFLDAMAARGIDH